MTADELKAWRLAQGLTREALARYLDVSSMTIYRWETGRRRVPHLVDLSVETYTPKGGEYDSGN